MKGSLIGLLRIVGGLAAFALLWPSVALLAVITLWWNLIAALALVGGKRGRFYVGRFLGAYPFSYAVVLVLGVAAILHCCLRGVWSRVWFRQAAEDCVATLETMGNLRPMGGLW